MNQCVRRRTPSPPKKVQRVQSPVQEPVPSGQEEKISTGAGRVFPLHEKYDLHEGVSGTTGDKRRYYIVKASRLPRSEEELNVDLPAYFMHIYKEDGPRPDGYSSKDQPLKRITRSFTRR